MINTTIAQYTILEKLGEGGMGVVYKAHDTKLDRFVALKFLPAHLNASAQDKARFTIEAKAAASLNHPNVCSIIDIQEHDGQMFIVMEFVDGQTLREKERGLGLRQGIDIGIQIADGLAAAHEKGIVHRDIKPENIMIRKDGIAQIMDFGLAKLRTGGSRISRITKEGSTVGTAGYMSPEQIQGQDADHRSDIFSYGVLLYELLAGQLPFRGAHETALMYEIVNIDAPPMSSVKPEIDETLDGIVLECLAKEPSERSQSVAEVAKDLRRYKRESTRAHATRTYPTQSGLRQPKGAPQADAALPPAKTLPGYLPWGIAALCMLVALYLGYRVFGGSSSDRSLIITAIVPPDSVYIHSYGQASGPPVLSPDGRKIVYVGVTPDGVAQLYVRAFKDTATKVLEGTRGAQYPFWSPDGKFVAFFDGNKLKKVEATGGSPVTVCDAVNPRGGTWSSAGVILFTPEFQSPVFSVPEGGGTPVPITKLDSNRSESSHRWPYALPDGKHFLFFARVSTDAGTAEGHAVYGATVDGKTSRLILNNATNAAYASGYLLFVRSSLLMAQKFDQSTLETSGEPVSLANGVIDDPAFNLAVFSVSQNGTLLYQTGHATSGAKLLIMDRAGKLVSTLGEKTENFSPRYSGDGRSILAAIFDHKIFRLNIWEYDLRSGDRNRLTSGIGENIPIWSPDQKSIAYSSQRTGYRSLCERTIEGNGQEVELTAAQGQSRALDWSRDGSSILYSWIDASKTRSDLWMVQTGGKHEKRPVVNTEFDEPDGRFSPDGNWIAYSSDESGQHEVYIIVNKPGGNFGENRRWKVSSGGGDLPRWAGNSSELCYVNNDNQLVLETIGMNNGAVEVKGSHVLFRLPAFLENYDVSPEGKNFVVNLSLEQEKAAPLTIMMNWDEELSKK